MNLIFIFSTRKYLIWDTKEKLQEDLLEYTYIINSYISYWIDNEPQKKENLTRISKNINYMQSLLKQGKKIDVICEIFLISLLGGYVGGLLSRETSLTDLVWMSDRDRSNELGNNIIRDLFQITLINITKYNINYSFTSANTNSDEWYEELIRIPDYLTGTISNFDFNNMEHNLKKPTIHKMLKYYFYGNIEDSFLYRFHILSNGMKIQRMLIT